MWSKVIFLVDFRLWFRAYHSENGGADSHEILAGPVLRVEVFKSFMEHNVLQPGRKHDAAATEHRPQESLRAEVCRGWWRGEVMHLNAASMRKGMMIDIALLTTVA